MALRKKYFLFSLLAAAAMGLFALWNLGQEENDPRTLYFSRAPGFYDTAFQLEILSDIGAEVFYTTDGSDPDRNAIPYTGPITISDPSGQPVRYASRRDVSAGFLKEEHQQALERFPEVEQWDPGYAVPEQVDQCTVLRAAAYDGEVCLSTVTGTYFVGMQSKALYEDFALVSLVTDPGNLFDYDRGIYVTGRKLEEFWEAGGLDLGYYWIFWEANYTQRGRESERPAHIEIFGEDRSLMLSSECGIRIHGNMSRSTLPKSLRVYSRREYSGSEYFSASPISGNDTQPHKFLLFAGGNDNQFMLKDAMVHQLCQELNVTTMDMHPCLIFLDGEFWGSSYIAEVYDRKFLQDHYGIPEDSVAIIKEGELSEGEESDLEDYRQMVDFITREDMTREENYRQACQLIDTDSYIDYYAAMIYLARQQDWPIANFSLWRAKVSPAGEGVRDGRWRWMLFDLNSKGMESEFAQMDTLKMVLDQDAMFASLWENQEFKALFCSRLRAMAAEVFTEEHCRAYLETYEQKMVPAIRANSLRFYGTDREAEIRDNILDIRGFFQARPSFVDTMIQNNLGEEAVP